MDSSSSTALHVLSARERDCLRSLSEGLTTKQAAVSLGISYSTLNKHLSSARTKLGVGKTYQALLIYQRHRKAPGGDTATPYSIEMIAQQSAALSDLASDLQHCRTFDEAWQALHKHTSRIGVDEINFGLVAEPPGHLTNGAKMLGMSLPDELIQMYEDMGGMHSDPFVAMSTRGFPEMILNNEHLRATAVGKVPPKLEQFGDALLDHKIRFVIGKTRRDPLTDAPYTIAYNLRRKTERDLRQNIDQYRDVNRTFADLFWGFIQSRRLLRPFVPLTARQREALQFAARGFTNAQSAEQMGISNRSVEKLLAEARKIFAAPTTAAAVYRAMVYRALT